MCPGLSDAAVQPPSGRLAEPARACLLLYSLESLGHACRGSPSFRNFVRAQNTREKQR